jgi:hypothetical protein
MPAIYTKKHLLAALAQAKLPHSYRTLMVYEDKNIIPGNKTGLQNVAMNDQRFYTADEIEDIVGKVREHKKKHTDA